MNQETYSRAKEIIPGGTQLLSKRPEMFLPDYWPSYYTKAKGCAVTDLEGNDYFDLSYMGVGSCVLGYAFDPVDEAAKAAIDNGVMCTLNAPEEVELAELLLRLHPWADMVRYAKAGGEAMSVAVRIARAATKKDIVLICGYHGWTDWYIATNLESSANLNAHHLQGLEPSGVPSQLRGTTLPFCYNDIGQFYRVADSHKGDIAAVVMEPIRNDYPKDGFLEKIRDYTKENGIPLIYDEVSAGFRLACGGSHKALGVEPDIAVFAKAMSNGYPMTAVIGRKEFMDAAQGSFISSTFWTERVGLAATIAAISYFEENRVELTLQSAGERVQTLWREAAEASGLDIHIGGITPMSHFAFTCENHLACKTYFTQLMLERGFLASTAYYASIAHTDEILAEYETAVNEAFGLIKAAQDDGTVEDKLNGPICHSGFQRLN